MGGGKEKKKKKRKLVSQTLNHVTHLKGRSRDLHTLEIWPGDSPQAKPLVLCYSLRCGGMWQAEEGI